MKVINFKSSLYNLNINRDDITTLVVNLIVEVLRNIYLSQNNTMVLLKSGTKSILEEETYIKDKVSPIFFQLATLIRIIQKEYFCPKFHAIKNNKKITKVLQIRQCIHNFLLVIYNHDFNFLGKLFICK